VGQLPSGASKRFVLRESFRKSIGSERADGVFSLAVKHVIGRMVRAKHAGSFYSAVTIIDIAIDDCINNVLV